MGIRASGKPIVFLTVMLAAVLLIGAYVVSGRIEAEYADMHEVAGHWEGAINVLGQELIIMVDFTAEGDELSGTIDIPQQGAFGAPLANIQYESSKIHFELPVPNARADFDGVLEGHEISGKFLQSGIEGTFTLTREVREAGASDPAEEAGGEEEPLEVGRVEEVVLETPTGSIYGTLQLPETDAKCPVVLIHAGSGPTDRDGNSPLLPGKNDSLKMIAQGLAEAGIASLRFDKRGVAKSVGAAASEADLRLDHYIEDVIGWIELLKDDGRFSAVVVLGHSEGSLISMAAVNKSSGVSGVISVAGAGKPVYEMLEEQLANQPKEIRDESMAIMEELKQGRTVANVSPELMMLFRPSVQPYMMSWFKYDPRVEIANLDVPVLILQGTTDLQVSVENAELLAEANPGARLRIIANMNHILKEAPLDPQANVATYSDPELPLAPGFLQEIISFVKECCADVCSVCGL